MYSKWNALPIHLRHQIAAKYGVAKTAPTHVQDNRIVSDGYRFEDIERVLVGEFTSGVLAEAYLDSLTAPVPADEVAALVTEPTAINDIPLPVEKKFCDFCTSKGGRHLKVCTKPN